MAAGRALPEATDSSQKSTCSVYTKRKVKLDQKALHTDVHPYAQSFSLTHTHNKQTNKHNTHTRTHNRSHVGTQPQTHRHTHKLNCTTTRALASFRSRQLLSLFFSSFFPSSFPSSFILKHLNIFVTNALTPNQKASFLFASLSISRRLGRRAIAVAAAAIATHDDVV